MDAMDHLIYCLLVSACRRLDRGELRATVLAKPYDIRPLAPFCPLERAELERRADRALHAGIRAVCLGDPDYRSGLPAQTAARRYSISAAVMPLRAGTIRFLSRWSAAEHRAITGWR
jgi:hypothetical protein